MSGMCRDAAWLASACEGQLVGLEGTELVSAPVVIDSRQVSDHGCFVAIVGENVDGHDYAPAAYNSTKGLVVISSKDLDVPHIRVQDTVDALGKIAYSYLREIRQYREANGLPFDVAGVTGSVGKTTTKDLTRQIFASQGATVAPQASFNNEIGLPLTILEADNDTRYLLLEMGASGPGHIAYLTDIAPLDVAAVLMVGHAHMGGFGSVEAVARAKSEIIQGLRSSGVAILNADDPRTMAMAELAPGPVFSFSPSGEPANVRADDVVIGPDGRASFTARTAGASAPVQLQIVGAHHVANALAALTIALVVGIDLQAAAQVLSQAQALSPHRMDVHSLSGQVLLIDDSYNANIDSVTAALVALKQLAGKRRKVFVAGQMLELGDTSEQVHMRTAELAQEAGVSDILAIGEAARPLARRARELGIATTYVDDADQALTMIDQIVTDFDAVLVKGSHSSGAWRIADYLKEVRA